MKSRNTFITDFKSIKDCKTDHDIYRQHKPHFIEKSPLPKEYEWERIKRLRKSFPDLFTGGQYRGKASKPQVNVSHLSQYLIHKHCLKA